jgi:hypothetical protein
MVSCETDSVVVRPMLPWSPRGMSHLLPASIALGLALLASACGGGGGTTTDPGPSGGLSWHASSVGSALNVFGPLNPPALAVDVSGAPLLAYADGGGTPHAAKMGTDWTDMGTSPVGAHPDQKVTITRTASGAPVFVWTEYTGTNATEIHAAAFSGNGWAAAGGLLNGTAGGPAYMMASAAGPKGPVVAWTMGGASAGVNAGWVVRLEGSAWRVLGSERPVKALTAGFSLAATPAGDPIVGYVAGDGTCTLERWDDGAGTWQALPTTGASCSAGALYVAVDGSGASYAAGLDTTATQLQYALAGVYRLAPGASNWTSLGAPTGFIWTGSALALAGLRSSGVAIAWVRGSREVASYAAGKWQTLLASGGTGYAGWIAPMLAVNTDDDLYLGVVNNLYTPSVYVQRLCRY